jgi:hypothetical protein
MGRCAARRMGNDLDGALMTVDFVSVAAVALGSRRRVYKQALAAANAATPIAEMKMDLPQPPVLHRPARLRR